MPGSPNLIGTLYLKSDILMDGKTAQRLSESIVACLEENKIKPSQLSSACVDGLYIKFGVPDILRKSLCVTEGELPFMWDPLHKLGLADKHVSNSGEYPWLTAMTDLCRDLYHHFMWGNNLEQLKKAAEELGVHYKNLSNFSDTRFANSKRGVFLDIFNSLQSIMAVLEADVENMISKLNGTEQEKKKGLEARELKGRLLNKEALLTLAGLCDHYEVFGELVNIVQEVGTLPHLRYDKFNAVLVKFRKMVNHFEDSDCEGNRQCLLKHFHSSVKSLQADGSIQSIPIIDNLPVQAAGLSSSTRSQGRRDKSLGSLLVHNPASALVQERLKHFGNSLHKDFEDNTYNMDHRDIINTTRDILDFECFVNEMKEQELSSDIYSANTFPRFRNAAKALHVPCLEAIKDEVILHQYRAFMRILVKLTDKSKKVDPKQILVQLFDEKENHYQDIQLILHIASCAATKSSVESVMESIVSSYEYASDSRKGFKEESINDVFEIISNGPSPTNCDKIVTTALDNYFKKQKWHFITDRVFKKSETILRLEQQRSSLPFME